MGQLIHHWQITGNDTLHDIISQALQWQSGENHDYKPKNWSVQLVSRHANSIAWTSAESRY